MGSCRKRGVDDAVAGSLGAAWPGHGGGGYGNRARGVGCPAAVVASENAGVINYVGITNNIERRAAEQLASKGISIEENGGTGGGQLLNKINSIAKTNTIYEPSIERGCAILSVTGRSAPNVCG